MPFSSDGYITCLVNTVPDVWGVVWFYSFSFFLVSAILLLNMLIAMMAKTFDNVWEASETQSQYLFARLVFFQAQR